MENTENQIETSEEINDDYELKISNEDVKDYEEENEIYSFQIKELMDLKKYLKTKIFGQNHIIDQIVDNLLMNTFRTQNNDRNLWVFLQFGPSWSWKNYLWELIWEKLGFWYEIIDLSAMHFIEITSLLWVTSGYGNGNDSIFENIYETSLKHDKKCIIIFDEFDKWQVTDNADCAKFLMSLMSILWSKKVKTKDTNMEILLSNFIFVFNSNHWFDNFKIEENITKIGFDIEEKKKKQNKSESNTVSIHDIENYFKKDLKVQVSVYNRLKTTNNILIYNQLEKKILDNYKKEKFNELKNEISTYMWVKKDKLPSLDKYYEKFKNYDIKRWFRGLNDIIFQEIKLELIKKYWLKSQFKNLKV